MYKWFLESHSGPAAHKNLEGGCFGTSTSSSTIKFLICTESSSGHVWICLNVCAQLIHLSVHRLSDLALSNMIISSEGLECTTGMSI